jgi:large exoprotein involved in heme utilization and adhesion
LSVTASDTVEVIGTSADGQFPSGLFTQALGEGDAGNLTIATGRLLVRDGAQVSAGTFRHWEGRDVECHRL